MKKAFIGSGEYKGKDFVIEILGKKVNLETDVVVSGHSPRNKYDNVDIWAEEWARDSCDEEPIIHKSKGWTSSDFKARNRLIAIDADEIYAFIPEGQYRSGTWNTIKHFRDLNKNMEKVKIYDQWGKLWKKDKLPTMMFASPNSMQRCEGCGKVVKTTDIRGKQCVKCKYETTLGAWIK